MAGKIDKTDLDLWQAVVKDIVPIPEDLREKSETIEKSAGKKSVKNFWQNFWAGWLAQEPGFANKTIPEIAT